MKVKIIQKKIKKIVDGLSELLDFKTIKRWRSIAMTSPISLNFVCIVLGTMLGWLIDWLMCQRWLLKTIYDNNNEIWTNKFWIQKEIFELNSVIYLQMIWFACWPPYDDSMIVRKHRNKKLKFIWIRKKHDSFFSRWCNKPVFKNKILQIKEWINYSSFSSDLKWWHLKKHQYTHTHTMNVLTFLVTINDIIKWTGSRTKIFFQQLFEQSCKSSSFSFFFWFIYWI